MATSIALSQEHLDLIAGFSLGVGIHRSFSDGACAMELVSFVAGEPWSDHPECVCPVLGAFIRAWNDGLPDDRRTDLIRPLLPRLIGTRGSDALAERRALMAADWLVRVHAPAWLRLAKLDEAADALEQLPEITTMAQIPSIRGPIEAARRDAVAAWVAARAAAWVAARAAAWTTAGAAARDAAWATAGAAAGAAAWTTAGAAAWDAARAAAGAAAWTTAGAAVKPAQDRLIESARALIERMIDAEEAA